MDLIHAVILSIIEGITEFLPVSSTGHLILATKVLGITSTEFTKSFDIAIQLGAIAAILTLYARTLLTRRELWPRLIAALLPTLLVGFFLYPFIKASLLDNTGVTVAALAVGGVVLWAAELYFAKQKAVNPRKMSLKTAFAIGAFQAISVIPGVSRAGATIVGGMLLGLPRREAVEFSFLLALPTMAAATGLDLVKSSADFTSGQIGIILLGMWIAWITALVTVRYFLTYVQKHTLIPFAVYRLLLAAAFFFFVMGR